MDIDALVATNEVHSSSDDDEPLATALSRLSATMTKTLHIVRQSSSEQEQHYTPTSSGRATPRGRRVNLRFPTPVYVEDLEQEEEREFGKISFGKFGRSQVFSDDLSLRLERLSMQLEDLASATLPRICAVVSVTQPITLSEDDIAAVENSLRKLRTENFAVVSLGAVVVQAYYQQADDGDHCYTGNYEESGYFLEDEVAAEPGETELAQGVGEEYTEPEEVGERVMGKETLQEWKEKCGMIEKAWKRMREEKLQLKLVEKFLAEKERSIQLQTVTLTRLQRDFEASHQHADSQSRERYLQILFLQSQIEKLMQDRVCTAFGLSKGLKLAPDSGRRQKFEEELDEIRKDIDRLEGADNEVHTFLESAEESFLQYLDTGDESKLVVRLESLKTKVLAVKVHRTLQQNQRKTDSINSTIEAMAASPQLARARMTIKNSVLQRCSTRPASPARKTIVDDPFGMDFLDGGKGRRGMDGYFTPNAESVGTKTPQETLFITNQSSIQEEGGDWSTGDLDFHRVQSAVKGYETRIKKWKSVVSTLKEKLNQCNNREEMQREAQVRLKIREKRLILLENIIKEQQSLLKSREITISEREDELKALFSQSASIPAEEISKFLSKSSARVTAQIHNIEQQMQEILRLHGEMNAEKSVLLNLKKEVEGREHCVEVEKTALVKEGERLEVLEKGVRRVMKKMMEVC